MSKVLQEYIESIVKETLLESKQNIINLGFPEVIASILFDKFGKNAFLIARWLRESDGRLDTIDSGGFNKGWWRNANRRSFTLNDEEVTTLDMVDLYNAAKTSQEAYVKELTDQEFDVEVDRVYDLKKAMDLWKKELEGVLNKNLFFRSRLIKDIVSGKIKNLKPYKTMSFQDAKDSYDSKRIFDDQEPIKTYKNGWKWIDAGRSCQLVGGAMKNCGSTGVMSMDKDKTMLTLFDTNNKPHVVVTYSPNEKRISGDEGVAGSAVKEEYHDYVLDLADHLGVRFDETRTKSKILMLKSMFRNKYKSIKKLPTKEYEFSEYFEIKLKDGSHYYSDGRYFVTKEELASLKGTGKPKIRTRKDGLRKAFHYDSDLRKRLSDLAS